MKKFIILITLVIVTNRLMAQSTDTTKKTTSADSLFNTMNADNPKQNVPIFFSSRLILSQTTETVKKNNLNFLVLHHFGDLAGDAGGGKTFFGLDAIADVYMGFEYGLTDNLNIDIGRSTIPEAGGLAQLELKYAVLHQTSDDSSPLAITGARRRRHTAIQFLSLHLATGWFTLGKRSLRANFRIHYRCR